jgi:hypothetical protein
MLQEREGSQDALEPGDIARLRRRRDGDALAPA